MTKQLDANQRLRVRTLFFDAHFNPREIERVTGYTRHQIRLAISAPTTDPKPRPGRPRKMTTEDEEELVRFVSASEDAHRMTYLELSQTLFDGRLGQYAIRNALRRLGNRRKSKPQPPIKPNEASTTTSVTDDQGAMGTSDGALKLTKA